MSLLFLLGASELSVPIEQAAAVTDACAKLRILSDEHIFCENEFRFTVPMHREREIIFAMQAASVSCRTVSRKGLLSVLEKYRARVGLLVGVFLFALIVPLASGIVWQIDIVGNSILSEGDVLSALQGAGLTLGTRLSRIDTDSIERRTLLVEGRISWISVNMSGTTAYVEIRERIDADKPERTKPYANIVSCEDAMIVEIETYAGMATVRKGSYVRKGEMLINGIIYKETLGTYPTYADGRVIGRIRKQLEFELPYRYSFLEDTGRRSVALGFIIFGKEIIFSPFSDEYDSYRLTSRTYAATEGRKTLPFYVTVNTTFEQMPKFRYRSPRNAQEDAMRLLRELIDAEYPDAEIVEKRITVTEGESSLILCADVTLDCEIGRVSEFDIDN